MPSPVETVEYAPGRKADILGNPAQRTVLMWHGTQADARASMRPLAERICRTWGGRHGRRLGFTRRRSRPRRSVAVASFRTRVQRCTRRDRAGRLVAGRRCCCRGDDPRLTSGCAVEPHRLSGRRVHGRRPPLWRSTAHRPRRLPRPRAVHSASRCGRRCHPGRGEPRFRTRHFGGRTGLSS